MPVSIRGIVDQNVVTHHFDHEYLDNNPDTDGMRRNIDEMNGVLVEEVMMAEPMGKNLFDQRLIPLLWQAWESDGDEGYTGKANGTGVISSTFDPETAYRIRLEAYNENGEDKTGNGLGIQVTYTDDTSGRVYLPRNTTEYTILTGRSSAQKSVKNIKLLYSSGGTDVWHIKNIAIFKGGDEQQYEPYSSTAVDVLMRDLFVTPQMFGAVGDGVTDDTAAFQKALDSEYNLSIPFGEKQCYLITNTLLVNTPYQQIVGNHGHFFVPSPNLDINKIIFKADSTADFGKPLFAVRTHDVRIIGLTAIFKPATEENETGGLFLDARIPSDDPEKEYIADVDVYVKNCFILDFWYVVRHSGRGLNFVGNAVAKTHRGFYLYWEEKYGTLAGESDKAEHRAIVITDNRFHVQRGTLVYLRKGYFYGMDFSRNLIDMGRGTVIYADTTDAVPTNLKISDNVINMAAATIIKIKSGTLAKSSITNNVISAVKGRWTGSRSNDIRPSYIIDVDEMSDCVVSGNVLGGSKLSAIRLRNVEGSIIQSNNAPIYSFDNNVSGEETEDDTPDETDSRNSFITVEGTVQKTSIVGNVSRSYTDLISCADNATPTLSSCVIANNIIGSGQVIGTGITEQDCVISGNV